MAEIKSALEMALERASKIKVDESKIKENTLVKEGQKLFAKYLNDDNFNITENLSDPEKKASLIKGIKDSIISFIKLPNTESDIDRLEKIKNISSIVIDNKSGKVEEIFSNIFNLYSQYVTTSTQIYEKCIEEYAPRLQQKAMEVARRTGQNIDIKPEQDRDFLKFHKETMKQVNDQFNHILDQLKAALGGLF